jgi:hypothetical protein
MVLFLIRICSLCCIFHQRNKAPISIPENTHHIEPYAFKYAYQLENIIIHKNITQLSGQYFENAYRLKTITVDEENLNYRSIDGVLYSYDLSRLIKYPAQKEGAFVILEDVEIIGEYAFAYTSKLTDLQFSQGLKLIEQFAFFKQSSLNDIVLPEGLETIQQFAFLSASTLRTVHLPSTLENISDATFFDMKMLEQINIPENVISIGTYAFANTPKLRIVTVEADLPPALGMSPFESNHSNRKFYVPFESYQTYIDTWTEYQNDIYVDIIFTVTFESTEGTLVSGSEVQHIYFGDYAIAPVYERAGYILTYLESFDFIMSDLHIVAHWIENFFTYTIAGNQVTITGLTFDYPYNYLTIPNLINDMPVVSIQSGAFMNNQHIEHIQISDSVHTIGALAFSNMNQLKSIQVSSEHPVFKSVEGVLYDKQLTKLLIVPGSFTELTLPETVTTIGNGAFYRHQNIEQVNMPNGLAEIEDYAFYEAINLQDVTFPNTLTHIGNYAFMKASSIENVQIGELVELIGEHAFRQMTALQSFIVHANNLYYQSVDGALYTKRFRNFSSISN